MKSYIIIVNKEVSPLSYTSLLQTCNEAGVPYNSATRGKRQWVKKGVLIEIKEIEVIKIRGRGKK